MIVMLSGEIPLEIVAQQESDNVTSPFVVKAECKANVREPSMRFVIWHRCRSQVLGRPDNIRVEGCELGDFATGS